MLSFSILRQRRFTRGGRSRGLSLIEIVVGIAILALVLGIILVTVTQRADQAKDEGYANAIVAVMSQHQATVNILGARNRIDGAGFETAIEQAITGLPDVAGVAVPPTMGTSPPSCANGGATITLTNYTAPEAQALGRLVWNRLSGRFGANKAAQLASYNATYDGTTWTTTTGATDFIETNIVKTAANNLTICI